MRFVSCKVKRAAKLGTHRHALEGLEVSREGGHTRPRSRGSQAGQGALADFQKRRSCPHEAAPPPWPKATLPCRVPFPETRNGLHWWFCIRLGGPSPREGQAHPEGLCMSTSRSLSELWLWAQDALTVVSSKLAPPPPHHRVACALP